MLLRTEPILFNDNPLQLSEETPGGSSRSRLSAPPAKTGGMFVPRTAISRPRAGLGKARKLGIGAITNATAPSSAPLSEPQQGRGQDDFRKMLSGDR